MSDNAFGIARGAGRLAHRNGIPFIERTFKTGQRRVLGQQLLIFMRAKAVAWAAVLAVADINHLHFTLMLRAQ